MEVGQLDGGLSDPLLEKQIPRARKKALGMTNLKKGARNDKVKVADDPIFLWQPRRFR
jgi:hypothetical protein